MATDNFTPLCLVDWQVHVYGDATAALQNECKARGLALHVFAWRDQLREIGLQRSATYLVRPDGYVALADASGNTALLAAYLESRGIKAAIEKAMA